MTRRSRTPYLSITIPTVSLRRPRQSTSLPSSTKIGRGLRQMRPTSLSVAVHGRRSRSCSQYLITQRSVHRDCQQQRSLRFRQTFQTRLSKRHLTFLRRFKARPLLHCIQSFQDRLGSPLRPSGSTSHLHPLLRYLRRTRAGQAPLPYHTRKTSFQHVAAQVASALASAMAKRAPKQRWKRGRGASSPDGAAWKTSDLKKWLVQSRPQEMKAHIVAREEAKKK